MKGQLPLFSKESDEWETPQLLFDELNKEFDFTVDGAASSINHKCEKWLGPGSTICDDALETVVENECIWINPPYSNIKGFMEWANNNRKNGTTSVLLVPSRTDTKWWHKYVWCEEWNRCYAGVEIRFIKGRVKFVGGKHSAPFPSVIVVMRGN